MDDPFGFHSVRTSELASSRFSEASPLPSRAPLQSSPQAAHQRLVFCPCKTEKAPFSPGFASTDSPTSSWPLALQASQFSKECESTRVTQIPPTSVDALVVSSSLIGPSRLLLCCLRGDLLSLPTFGPSFFHASKLQLLLARLCPRPLQRTTKLVLISSKGDKIRSSP
jgi:hypothetical protein